MLPTSMQQSVHAIGEAGVLFELAIEFAQERRQKTRSDYQP